MAIKENQEQQPVETNYDASEQDGAFAAEGDTAEKVPSEVVMRINLLGKLIIPPPTP